MMKNSKEDDSTFVALKNETFEKFRQFTFEDAATGKTMQYNLLVPDGYDGKTSYPLVLFMADASTVGKDVTTPLTQGYGALEFALLLIAARFAHTNCLSRPREYVTGIIAVSVPLFHAK